MHPNSTTSLLMASISPDFMAFPEHTSAINLNLPHAADLRNQWDKILADHGKALATASSQGSETAQKSHVGRGQLLARDRVALLLDEDSPFLELAPFAGHQLEDSTASASVVAGIGMVW